MSDPPVFSKLEADRILKRAAEIEGTDDHGPLTVEDLRSIAGEAGFGARAVERAIAEARQARQREVKRSPVHQSGVVVTKFSTSRTVPVEITSAQLMRAVRLFHPYRDGTAHIELEEHQVSWRDRKGISFTISSAGGVTEIQVFVSKILIRKARLLGWVKAAADRIESLVYLIATSDLSGGPLLPDATGDQAQPGQPEALPSATGAR